MPILTGTCLEAPHVGTIKINVDASFVQDEAFHSVSLMARDHEGEGCFYPVGIFF